MRKTVLFINDIFLKHDPGYGHPESPDRLKIIYDTLKGDEKLLTKFIYPSFNPADYKVISLIHNQETIKAAEKTSGKKYEMLDQDTITSSASYEAAQYAAGAMIKGVDMLFSGEVDNGFALVRPPGHHAERDKSMGFCLFNNIAIGAKYALKEKGVRKVLIVDFDVHHGNGTQHSFYDTNKVLFISPHQYPFYPGTGSLGEVGSGLGEGYTLNIPLSSGMGDMDYAAIFKEIVIPVARQYKPELILVSGGFDIHIKDPIGGMNVTAEGVGYIVRKLVLLAEELCGGKILVTLEGGYDIGGQAEGAFAVMSELLGESIECEYSSNLNNDTYLKLDNAADIHPEIVKATIVAKRYWKM